MSGASSTRCRGTTMDWTTTSSVDRSAMPLMPAARCAIRSRSRIDPASWAGASRPCPKRSSSYFATASAKATWACGKPSAHEGLQGPGSLMRATAHSAEDSTDESGTDRPSSSTSSPAHALRPPPRSSYASLSAPNIRCNHS